MEKLEQNLQQENLTPLMQEDLLGHEDVEKSLRRLIEGNKLPHGLLITGPQGIGKETLGCRLSRFLCVRGASLEEPKNLEDLGSLYTSSSHPIFRRFVQGSYGDFLSLPEKESSGETCNEIGVENIRRVLHFLHQTPREGSVRCVLINDAHLMNRNAANALLKSLEAPPSNVFLILITHKEHSILPTLLSRVHKVRLFPLEESSQRQVLQKNFKELEEAEIDFLTSISEGSPGFAQAAYVLGGRGFYEKFCTFLQKLSTQNKQIPFEIIQIFMEKHKNAYISWDFIYGYFLKVVGFVFLEKHVSKDISSLRPFSERIALWERLQEIFESALLYDLDPKQTLICAFSSLQETL